ncbi:MAG: ABC transporter ATP-binding protein [Nitrospirae bacterium]|nr:ABC transporter ATP-binding protein [Nitrospirota bacterium]
MTGIAQTTAFSLHNIIKDYTSREGTAVRALDSVSLDAEQGRITCLVGPTGSGKSTILRIISGIEEADSGSAQISGRKPHEFIGKLGYLTQHHTLLPWMRIRDNIGLPLDIVGQNRETQGEKVARICELLGLQGTESLYPYELSGGMQQRAAIGRLLAGGAPYWLMDEPFSALDEKTRQRLQRLLLQLVRENSISALFVTHSIDEAVFLADRVVILSAGPGRVIETFDIAVSHPRDRLSNEYGRNMERIRRKIESVLSE